ncbi:VOC family protein [Celeribacter indicus]|uniref:Glyoxalase-like domain-containing protein n=1 Tax=Celeribacter indicus TaxID=1208324 RepID=A0A0B5E4Z5_9RHOB|nr:VOC family protein [Celeribacter indicus]AJE48081.1 hypothetical protein P73_3366 [Celeribacter indicus]SDW32122.1 Glyoxalase-like domain-containing protein [Celeribacter indicus]
MSYRIDHLVISASDLEHGCDAVEALLDIRFGPVGKHAEMGTEARLAALAPDACLEVIAPDPAAPRPAGARWFDLDNFGGPPRFTGWVVACDDLEEAWKRAPADVGRILSFRRGEFAWRMVVPESGVLPFDNCFPALIEWHSGRPARTLPDQGLRLRRLKIAHPEAGALREALAPFVSAMENVRIVQADRPGLMAEIGTASGEIWIT